MSPELREAILKEYGEVSNNFRALTDIRFRLLTLLPIATAVTVALKTDPLSPGGLPLALFGLVATIGLVTYNARNDQLYDALVGRAATIERALGLPDGAFANRPRPWLWLPIGCWRRWEVSHRPAIGLLYGATIAFWLFMTLGTIMAHVWADAPILRLTAMLAAVLVTVQAERWVRNNERQRGKELRRKVGQAVDRLLAAEQKLLAMRDSPTDPKTMDLPEAAALLQMAEQDGTFLPLCADICGEKEGEKEEEYRVRAKARFYAGLDADALGFFLPSSSSGVFRAAFLLSLLVDFPPWWIFDVRTNRRGAVHSDDRRPLE